MNLRYRLSMLASAAAVVAAASACSPLAGQAVAPSTSAQAAQTSGSSETSASTPTSTGSVDNPHPHREFSVVHHEYQATSGVVSFDVEVPWIAGDDQAVVDRFNNSVLASLNDQQVALNGQEPRDGTWVVSSQKAEAVIGTDVITGLLVTSVNHHDPLSAHPTPEIATFVINKATAQPVMLTDLFTDTNTALQRLSDNAKQQLTAKLGADVLEENGIAPKVENFANWIPTQDGIEIHFADYQVAPHAAGLQVITVPWSVFDGVLAQKIY